MNLQCRLLAVRTVPYLELRKDPHPLHLTPNLLTQVPLVVRLEGTNVDNAKKILADANLKIESATDLDDAARKAVSMLNA